MSAPRLDVMVSAGDVDADVRTVQILEDRLVAVTLPLPDGAVTFTFEPERFLAFLERLRAFAGELPRPS